MMTLFGEGRARPSAASGCRPRLGSRPQHQQRPRLFAALPVLAMVALALALPVRAEMLFWTVDFDEAKKESPWTDPNTAPHVWLVATTDPLSAEGGTRLELQDRAQSVLLPDGKSMGGKITAADISGYDTAAYTFFVEMGAVAGQADYTSSGVSYDDLVSSGFVASGWSSMEGYWNASFTAWTPTHGVPEPTSGILALLGAALLALRRRRGSDKWGSDKWGSDKWGSDERGSDFPVASERGVHHIS